jgi:hypothetical protein
MIAGRSESNSAPTIHSLTGTVVTSPPPERITYTVRCGRFSSHFTVPETPSNSVIPASESRSDSRNSLRSGDRNFFRYLRGWIPPCIGSTAERREARLNPDTDLEVKRKESRRPREVELSLTAVLRGHHSGAGNTSFGGRSVRDVGLDPLAVDVPCERRMALAG